MLSKLAPYGSDGNLFKLDETVFGKSDESDGLIWVLGWKEA